MFIAQDGSGDFLTIQAAIDSVSKDNTTPITFYIKPGIYKEKLHIETPYLTFKGEEATSTIITYDDYARKLLPNGESYGTFRSYTTFIGTHDISFENITVENSSGLGDKVGQALAVYADGDRICFKNCRLLGYQDTLFTGPLPPAPMTPGSFVGPREHATPINGRQYYENCYIEGEVDFIFGSATAFFYGCEIFSHNRDAEINGYVTAASTPSGQAYGYVFENCHLTSNCKAQTVYLGRPWRNFAQTVFINCELDAHIRPEGWHNWNKPAAEKETFYAEYGSTGEGSHVTARATFSHHLDASKISYYSREQVLHGEDHWNPWQ